MSKQIVFNTEARAAIKRGIDTLCDAVSCTLGPKGRNVIIETMFGGSGQITKDGVTVAKAIELSDPIENIGAQMIKTVASKTVDLAGDGTTTATVIAQAIISEGFKLVAAGVNPTDLKRGIDKAVVIVVENLKKQSQKVGDNIQQIATISANSDEVIGSLIADAFKQVGTDGVITVKDSKTSKTYVEVTEGMTFDRGYISPYFITNSEKMTAELDNPLILIYDKSVSLMRDILPLLEKVAQAGRSLVLICENLDGEALASMVQNKIKGHISFAAIKVPSFGESRKEVLQDIAILTNGTFISVEQGLKLDKAQMEDLGTCASIVIDKDNTTIVGGAGDKEDITLRVTQIKAQIASSNNDDEKAILQERVSKLAGGVAVLYVGAATEIEMKEKKDRVDDALHATKAAIEEGIIPGGGVAYIRAAKVLQNTNIPDSNLDQVMGAEIIMRSIEAPLRKIIENAGKDAGYIIGKVKEGKKDYGYDAKNDNYTDMIKSGIVDPVKVARVALENAASVAGTLLTTECVIASNLNQNQN